MSDNPAVAEAEQIVSEATGDGAGSEGPKFTLELNQDQQDIRDWVHGFAEGVVRPAAEEWDEREETPWPVIQEAAKIGLYGFEALGQFWADDTGLTLPIANEELFWGDAGIGKSIMGTSLAGAAIFGQGTGEPIGEWIPRCFGTEAEPAGIITSSGVMSKLFAALATIQPSVSKLWHTPFGLPVLPEVKKMIAGSSGFGGMMSRAGVASASALKLELPLPPPPPPESS